MNITGYLAVMMIGLTKQEWRVLGIVAVLLLTGWATRWYRAVHPPEPGAARAVAAIQPAKP